MSPAAFTAAIYAAIHDMLIYLHHARTGDGAGDATVGFYVAHAHCAAGHVITNFNPPRVPGVPDDEFTDVMSEIRADLIRAGGHDVHQWPVDVYDKLVGRLLSHKRTLDGWKDGPVAPDSFRWRGKTCEGIAPDRMRLLSLLWTDHGPGRAVALGDVIKGLYGQQERYTEANRSRLKELVGHTRKLFRQAGFSLCIQWARKRLSLQEA